MNAAQIAGIIESIEQVGNSKLMVVRYGPKVEIRDDLSVQNTNEVLVRIPGSLLRGTFGEQINSLRIGERVVAYCRAQGVWRRSHSRQGLSVEIVASRVTRPEYEDGEEAEADTTAAAA
jgi:hypothetical protein